MQEPQRSSDNGDLCDICYVVRGDINKFMNGTNNKVHDSEVLQSGQQVITACAFIYHSFDGIYKVFVPRRSATKTFLPDTYELPGGHIEYGEDIIKGLKREISWKSLA